MIRNWRYFAPRGKIGELRITKYQFMTGNMVGILITGDEQVEESPSNICNAKAFDFPVRYKILDCNLRSGDKLIEHKILLKIKELELEGCRCIATTGGAFGLYYDMIRNSTSLMTLVTPLQALNFADISTAPDKKICVVNDLSAQENMSLLNSLSIDEAQQSRCIFTNKNFQELHDKDEIGAFIWDYPESYERLLDDAVPIYSMLKILRLIKLSTAQRPYGGEI